MYWSISCKFYFIAKNNKNSTISYGFPHVLHFQAVYFVVFGNIASQANEKLYCPQQCFGMVD